MDSLSAQHDQAKFEEAKQAVTALLAKYSIPFETWGTGSAKTLKHLIKEVMEGETVLAEEDGILIRKLSVTDINIFYTDPAGKKWRLLEEKQIFKDGRERRRPQLEGSMAEKLKAGEIPDQELVNRAIKEELGIESAVPATATGTRKSKQDSPSYPGLTMEATRYYFDAHLTDEQYKPEGYVERQEDKDNYFVWKEYVEPTQ